MTEFTNWLRARGVVRKARDTAYERALGTMCNRALMFDIGALKLSDYYTHQHGIHGITRFYLPLTGPHEGADPIVGEEGERYIHKGFDTLQRTHEPLDVHVIPWELHDRIAHTLIDDILVPQRANAEQQGYRLQLTTVELPHSSGDNTPNRKHVIYFSPLDQDPAPSIDLPVAVAGYVELGEVFRPMGSGAVKVDVHQDRFRHIIAKRLYDRQSFPIDYAFRQNGGEATGHVDILPGPYVMAPLRPDDMGRSPHAGHNMRKQPLPGRQSAAA